MVRGTHAVECCNAGDLGAVRLFSNGAPVTCYPFDAAYGTLNLDEWDALVPNKELYDADGNLIGMQETKHEPAAAFAKRNDLDVDDWCTRIKNRKALPNFPDKVEWAAKGKMELGDMAQRLLEGLETATVHLIAAHEKIADLTARVQSLEAAAAPIG